MTKKAPAKINVFLKLTKKRDIYHELKSRFVLIDELYDEISFVDKNTDEEFELNGNFGCEKRNNTIYKAYIALKNSGYEKLIEEYFSSKGVNVKKSIPEFSGLGGGSSDAATFLLMCNQELNLKLTKKKLLNIGLKVGADVPFFLMETKSANVSGIGEVIQEFDDDLPKIKLILNDVKCSTADVFREFNEKFIPFDSSWESCSSKMLLETFKNEELNDLLKPSLRLYPSLKDFAKKGYFLSGSGSSMFEVENG